ncbi:nuclear transport factor 2 family protein [Lactococcus lactis]|uniref:nuclear transport factor 2 family protein n=1 Tax=Lactococcus lactis TaxID=1358 RepID=UPI00241618F1|nr:nuclear transport factor 2 family protein [Lactococcus lactis]MDG4969516.1 nuclear transport factor 2 family protein [Lactococcus lactis]MDG5102735.1 nuclear transport factor 2 family protein [Lactococcus lactis]
MSYEELYTPEQKNLAEKIIEMEIDALNRFYKGDTSGYQNLWSKNNFSYFDANTFERIDTYEEIYDFLMNRVEGKLYAEKYEFLSPRVQFGVDMAVLTYQLHADTNFKSTHYNVIEVYQINEDKEWKVIHSTWAWIRPFAKDDEESKNKVII